MRLMDEVFPRFMKRCPVRLFAEINKCKARNNLSLWRPEHTSGVHVITKYSNTLK